jgi:hypothetical protein
MTVVNKIEGTGSIIAHFAPKKLLLSVTPFRPQNCNVGLGGEILRFRHRKSVFLQRNCEERLHTFTSTHERTPIRHPNS